jgi:hypothetical protein
MSNEYFHHGIRGQYIISIKVVKLIKQQNGYIPSYRAGICSKEVVDEYR